MSRSDDDQETKRPRGRPQAEERGSSLSTWVPCSLHDRAIQVANAREMSVSALICEALEIAVDEDERADT